MRRALLLNADWTPMHFISDWRAVRLVMNGRCEVVNDFETGEPALWDESFTSPGHSVRIPATLRLKRFVHKRWKPPRFRKKVLFNRDDWSCQYCGKKLAWTNIEVEHVLPSSRGGLTSWLNCVAACKPCNKRKADQTPEEAGMLLLRKPAVPTALHFWDAVKSDSWHHSWNPFIPKNAG